MAKPQTKDVHEHGGQQSAPVDRPVFVTATALLVLIIGASALAPDAAEGLFSSVQAGIVTNGSWFYVLVVAAILLSSLFIAFTRYGEIKLGPDHAEPDYSLLSWFSMLFAAGMGIGLMFFGVAEPVMHFLIPPNGPAGTVAAAQEAMTLTFFHWGLHAWAIYAIVAVILAYFSFRHRLPLTLRSALYPLIGDRIYGPLGTAVDVFAILSTTFGVATSLGFGVEQINAGLNYLFDVPKSLSVQLGLIVLTTLLATFSVVLGLDAGIKRLSELNIMLAVLLLLGILILGPKVHLLQMFLQNAGAYISGLVGKTFNLYAYEPTDWLGGWTIFYWGWWISWAPFVGLFIARISRGRTLREFVFGVVLGPVLFTLLWMTVFGNSAIDLILTGGADALAAAVQEDESVALFKFFEYYPFTGLLSGLAIIMVMVFFITSADSGAMVLNMLSSGGRDDTPTTRRIYWMAMIGISALVLLVAGGLSALQTAAIASALPFSLVILLSIWGFVRALAVDHAKRLESSLSHVAISGGPAARDWQARLQNLLRYPEQSAVQEFINTVAQPALEQFAAELKRHDMKAIVTQRDAAAGISLEVWHGDELDFRYEVLSRQHEAPHEALSGQTDAQHYYRAEVHLNEGSQHYDVMNWSQEQLLHDLLEQYEKHLHFLHLLR